MNKRIVLITNPIAGGGHGLKLAEKAAGMLKAVGMECVVRQTQYSGHATELAREAAVHGADVVVAVGGDGTVNEVARGLLKENDKVNEVARGLLKVNNNVNEVAQGVLKVNEVARGVLKDGCKPGIEATTDIADNQPNKHSSTGNNQEADEKATEEARELMESVAALGIIPCGSGNGLAFHLGIPTDVTKAVEIIKNGEIQTVDSGIINGKPFFCTCGVGYDAKVAYEYAQAGTRGLATYVNKALSWWKKYEPQEYVITADGEVIRTKALLVTCANANQWGNHCHIAPKASLKDGLLEVTIVLPVNIPDGIALACRLPGYKLTDDRHVISLHARNVTIERQQMDVAHFDGEAYMEEAVVKASIIPESLSVITAAASI